MVIPDMEILFAPHNDKTSIQHPRQTNRNAPLHSGKISMTISELITDLQDQIETAKEEAKESHTAAMNSYGAGFDAGFLNALTTILSMIKELPNP